MGVGRAGEKGQEGETYTTTKKKRNDHPASTKKDRRQNAEGDKKGGAVGTASGGLAWGKKRGIAPTRASPVAQEDDAFVAAA